MILIFGHQGDGVSRQVYECLRRRGEEVLFVEGANLSASVGVNYPLDQEASGHLLIDSHKIKFPDISGVLVRLREPFELDLDMSAEDQLYTRFELEATWKGLWDFLGGRVLNGRSGRGENGHTLFSSSVRQAFTKCGFRSPGRLVTSNVESASVFYERCGRRVVLSSPSRQVPWQLVAGGDGVSQLEAFIARLPVYLQETPAGRWLQVFVVGDEVYGASLPMGRRAKEAGEAPCQTVALSSALQERCRRLAQELRMDFAQFHLLLTGDGEAYCFELSDFPTSDCCDQKLQGDLTSALAELLKRVGDR
jgi:hypothetical protein